MREVCPEHDLGDAVAGREKVLPEYSFVKYGIARIIKTWAKNKITNVPVLTETILRNEKAKHKILYKYSNLFHYSELSVKQDDTEVSTGLIINLNFISSST